MHAHVENPVEAFGRLFHSARKPPLMGEGKMEHRLVMHHLLIHGDNVQADGGYARCCLAIVSPFMLPQILSCSG